MLAVYLQREGEGGQWGGGGALETADDPFNGRYYIFQHLVSDTRSAAHFKLLTAAVETLHYSPKLLPPPTTRLVYFNT